MFFQPEMLHCQIDSENVLQLDQAQVENDKRGLKFIPIGLMTVGIILNNTSFENDRQLDLRRNLREGFSSTLDDIFQFTPIGQMYLGDILGFQAQNHWFDQTKYLLFSNILSASLTFSLKRIINKDRPDGGQFAFPSGHTTAAFTNAGVFYYEFKDHSPFLSLSSFLFAGGTGTLRMLNNRHWLSDVLMGAGIGLFSVQLIYHLKPFKNFNPFKKKNKVLLIPNISGDELGFYFRLKL